MQSFFQTYYPTDPSLKKYISYFYIDVQEDENFNRKFSFFPHVNTTLTFYKNGLFTEGTEHNTVVCKNNLPLLQLLTRQRRVTTVIQEGPITKIGIVFHPLGLNHFVKEHYDKIAANEVQHFVPSSHLLWVRQLRECFHQQHWLDSILMLEEFLTALFNSRNYETLYNVLNDLNDIQNELSIQEIADKYFISLRKLQRDFQRELVMTPELYRMIARFRYAVQQRIQQEGPERLTTLAHESGYLDQSYMIRSFKKLTGLTPTAFFREGKHIGMADTFWRFHST